jgi:hypothetical protein
MDEILRQNILQLQNNTLHTRDHHFRTQMHKRRTTSRSILHWQDSQLGLCKDLTDVWAFVRTIGVCRLFIWNFAHWAHHIVKLTHKGAQWKFNLLQEAAMDNLKQALLTFWHFNQLTTSPMHQSSFLLTLLT